MSERIVHDEFYPGKPWAFRPGDPEGILAQRVGVVVTFDPNEHPDTIAETLFSMKRLRGVLKVECPENKENG